MVYLGKCSVCLFLFYLLVAVAVIRGVGRYYC